jgi:hypothetical protein
MQLYRRILAGLLSAVMIFGTTTTALAGGPAEGGTPPDGIMGEAPDGFMGEAPDGEPGGDGGGAGSASQEFATFDEVLDSALVSVVDGETTLDEDGIVTAGVLTATSLSGFSIDGAEGTNGLAIRMAAETDVFTIGGDEDLFEVDGEGYNTVIRAAAGQGNNDAGYEAVYGVAVGIETGTLWVKNSYLAAEGPRSTPVYAFSTASPAATSLVVEDSKLVAHSDELWMPSFKLLAGGARATLLMTRNNSWFYGSTVVSNNWGALSQDSVDATTYVVNSTAETTEGGYAAYLTYGLRAYGSQFYGAQYGLFLCGTTDVLTDNGAAALADSAAMSQLPDYAVDETASTIVAAPCNALVIHTSLQDNSQTAKAVFRNTTLSTLPEDLPDEVTPLACDDEFFLPGVDILGSGNGCGAAYFFTKNLYGSLALVRSMNADLTFDNAETRTSNGVLLQSVVTYDPPSASGYLDPGQGDTVSGITAAFQNGTYTGDILHQDYQRAMQVTVADDATLTGSVVSGTWAGWNALWTEEQLTAVLAEDGYTPDLFDNPDWVADVQTNLIREADAAYADTDNYGVSLTVAGTWAVTGTSTLSSLTIAEGGSVTAAEDGMELAVFTGCDTSNALTTYDISRAVSVADLVPGTYTDVTILVVPAGTRFADVTADLACYDAVLACAEAGILGGLPNGCFAPNASLTRAQAAAMVVRATGLSVTDDAAAPFADCSGHWSASLLAAAVEAGILSADTTFRPDDTITGAELAALLTAAGLPADSTGDTPLTRGEAAILVRDACLSA